MGRALPTKSHEKIQVALMHVTQYLAHHNEMEGECEGHNIAACHGLAPPCPPDALSGHPAAGRAPSQAEAPGSLPLSVHLPAGRVGPTPGSQQAVDTAFWFSGRTLNAETRTQQ